MDNIIDMYMYSCGGETSTHLITSVFSIKQKVVTPVDDQVFGQDRKFKDHSKFLETLDQAA